MDNQKNLTKPKLKIPWWAILIILTVVAIGLGFGIYFILKATKNNNTPSSDIDTVSSPSGQNAVLEMSNQVRSTCGCTNIISSPSGNINSAPTSQDCVNIVPPLRWDSKLEEMAISYSKLMAKCNCKSHYLYNGCNGCNSTSGISTYDQNPESGQNLEKINTPSKNPLSEENIYLTAISKWANEGWSSKSSNYLNDYTAMNWKNGTTVGCGISSVEKENIITYYVVCQYGADSDENIPNLENYAEENVLCTIPINVTNN